MSRERKNRNPQESASSARQRDTEKAKQRAERRRNRGNAEPCDWGLASADRLLRLVASATNAGDIISFGYTRDGGAYTVTIFDGSDRFVEYCRPTESVDDFLEMLRIDYDGV